MFKKSFPPPQIINPFSYILKLYSFVFYIKAWKFFWSFLFLVFSSPLLPTVWGEFFFFLIWTSNCLNIVYWKDYSFKSATFVLSQLFMFLDSLVNPSIFVFVFVLLKQYCAVLIAVYYNNFLSDRYLTLFFF